MRHRTKIHEQRSKQAAWKVKWTCSCGAEGWENTRPDAVISTRIHRFAQATLEKRTRA